MWVCQTLHTSNFHDFHSFLGPSLGICCCLQLTTPSSGGDCMEIHIPGPKFAHPMPPSVPHCLRVSAIRQGNGDCIWWACRHCQQRLILIGHPTKEARAPTYYHVPPCIPLAIIESAAAVSLRAAAASLQYTSKPHTASANKKPETPPYPWHTTTIPVDESMPTQGKGMPQASAEDKGKGQGSILYTAQEDIPPSFNTLNDRLDKQLAVQSKMLREISNNSNELSSLRGLQTDMEGTIAELLEANQQLKDQVAMMKTSWEDMAMRHPVITTEQGQSNEEEGFQVPMKTSKGWTT